MTAPRSAAACASAAFAFLVVMIGTTLPTPLYPVYQAQFGFSHLTITLIFAMYALGVMGALLLAGRWSDELGRRPMLLAGLLAAAASDTLFWYSDGLGLLLAGRLVSGLSAGIFTATASVAVLELAPAAWRRRASFIATAVNMGGLGLGPVLAGLLVEYLFWPLHLSYLLHFLLCLAALAALVRLPESVSRPARPRLRLQRLRVPASVRPVFVPAGIAGFAGFSLLGFFTATAPAFTREVLGHDSLALGGLAAGSVFFASTLGQLLPEYITEARRLPLGCLGVAAGALLVGSGIALSSLAVFLTGAGLAGLGQGLAFRAALAGTAQASPAAQRGAITASFFIISYVGLSLPILGIGAGAWLIGLQLTGIAFAGFVAATAAVSLALLRRAARAQSTAARTRARS